ncbi:hypothetical protein HanPI659440_Chr01g0005681 [Helianthus annuus]|nr:hypothetical protein HanPI659440_Chr01g0005681 [Helianthus annuus]
MIYRQVCEGFRNEWPKTFTLNQIKLLTTISTVVDLNYLEKTITYFMVIVADRNTYRSACRRKKVAQTCV